MKWGRAEFSKLRQMGDKLTAMSDIEADAICREAAGRIAAALLDEVKRRTPVGHVPDNAEKTTDMSGYTGGTLREAWTLLPIRRQGDEYVITLLNGTEYASFVEYGHRQESGRYVLAIGKSLRESWVEGRFMMTISVSQVMNSAPALLERTVYRALRGL